MTVSGDFKTYCYTRDLDECADDSAVRITRVYFGGQQCEIVDPFTNEFYFNLTQYQLICRLNKPEISFYNASILVSNDFGRSLSAASTFYVSPDENIYNFQTYAGFI